MAINGKMRQEGFNLRRAHLARVANPVPADDPRDPIHIGLFSATSVVSSTELLSNLVEELHAGIVRTSVQRLKCFCLSDGLIDPGGGTPCGRLELRRQWVRLLSGLGGIVSFHLLSPNSLMAGQREIDRRKAAALDAIKRAMGSEVDEGGVDLFISHHIAEIDEVYWLEHLGTSRPEPKQVLDLVELRSHWGDEAEDGMNTFDFTFPGDITNYVIAVRFDENGEVDEISMES